jgi:hypothetical protein
MAGRAKFTGRAVSGVEIGEDGGAGGDVERAGAGLHFEVTAVAAFHESDEEGVNRLRILQQLFRFIGQRSIVQIDFHTAPSVPGP